MTQKIQILYVDDEPNLLEIAKIYLERGGAFAVDTINSAIVALEKLALERYDAIISDYQMPEMDGIMFLRKIKASGNPTPFIIFTGKGREEVVIEALNQGADFYIQKGGDLKSQFAELSNKICYAVKQRQMEAALCENEEKFRGIFDTINDGVHIQEITPDGKPSLFIEVNDVACRMLQYSREEMLLEQPLDFVTGSYNRPSKDIINELSTTGHSIYETELRRRDGTGIPVEINSHKVSLQGKCVYVSVVRDITGRKQAEIALRESEDRFRTLASVALDGIMIHDRGTIIDCNVQFMELFGYGPEDIIGKKWLDFLVTAQSRDDITRWGNSGAYGTIDIVGIKKDGTRFFGETSSTSIRWQGNKHSIIQMRNISHRKETEQILQMQKYELTVAHEQISAAEEELRANYDELTHQNQILHERETQLRAILESTADGILAVDNSGKVIHSNRRFTEMWKIPSTIIERGEDRELLGSVLHQVADPDGFYGKIQRLYSSDEVDTDTIDFRDGRIIERYSIPMIMDGERIGRVWSFRDITLQKRSDEGLQESRRQLKSMASNIPGVVYRFSVNPEGGIGFNYVSERSRQILGLDNDQVHFFDKVTRGVFPEDREEFLSSMHQAIRTRTLWHYECRFRKPTGKTIWLSIMCNPVIEYDRLVFDGVIFDITDRKSAEEELNRKNQELSDSYERIVSSEKKLRASLHEISKSEETLRVSETMFRSIVRAIPRAFPKEQYHKEISEEWTHPVLVDSTEYRRSEESLHEVNQKLRLLTGLTRHDIFNQITVIQGSHELAIMESNLSAIYEYIFRAQQACERIETMIGFTSEYEEFGLVSSGWQGIHRMIELSKEEVSLCEVTTENRIPKNLEVYADPIIRKVFTTLLENAIRHGKKITTIRFTSQECSGNVVITCEDDGVGVREKEKDYIFNHGYGKNTGIGLFLTREILSITGLSISECGHEGKGARFEIRVPEGKYRFC